MVFAIRKKPCHFKWHLILALALYKKEQQKKGTIAFENAQMMDACQVANSPALRKTSLKKAHLMQRP